MESTLVTICTSSTGICFIGERNFSEFLQKYLPKQQGNIVNNHGQFIKHHEGLAFYTIGQRKGLEIGGGFGAVSRYGHMRGFADITIIDLPFANAVQAGFLAATLGEDKVRFHTEADRESSGKVTLWPSTRKASLTRNFALAINMDSLPEINAEEAQAYLDLIRDQADAFWSVNQEAEKETKGGMKQNRVSAMADAMTEFHRKHRHPYWLEQGYVEELYRINR